MIFSQPLSVSVTPMAAANTAGSHTPRTAMESAHRRRLLAEKVRGAGRGPAAQGFSLGQAEPGRGGGAAESPSPAVCYTPPPMAAPASPNPRPRVGMISLGCPKNLVDSEVMLGELARRGYEVVNDLDSAETVVVNTCAFIEEAQQESIDTILEVVARKGRGPGQGVERVLVAGCMVNRFGQELAKEIPEIDGFVGLDQLREVSDVVQIG